MTPKSNICFFGESGAGKTTAAQIAAELLNTRYHVIRCDIAEPLREIQNFCRKTFGLPLSGNPSNPQGFASDGPLLSFLAKHFETNLQATFETKLNDQILAFQMASVARETDKFTAPDGIQRRKMTWYAVNADCRNNCYDLLKRLNFSFIKIETSEENRKKRVSSRDLNLFPASSVENIDQIVASHYLNNDGCKDALRENIRTLLFKSGHLSS